jgi:hypothetical protein
MFEYKTNEQQKIVYVECLEDRMFEYKIKEQRKIVYVEYRLEDGTVRHVRFPDDEVVHEIMFGIEVVE